MATRIIGSGHRTLDWFQGRELPVPGLEFCAHSLCRRAVGDDAWAGLEAHRHQCWELSWLGSGAVEWWSDATGVHELGPGWCYLTAPGVRHGSITGRLEPGELWWFRFDPARLAGLDRTQRALLVRGLRGLPPAFPAAGLRPLWQELLAAVAAIAGAPDRALAVLRVQGCVLHLLARLLADHHGQEPSSRLARILAERERDYAGVAELAQAAGCSVTVLHRLFRAGLGDSPAAWLRRRRLARARARLRDGDEDVTAIAIDLGFASSQHFATRFRQLTGLSPSEYRAQARRSGLCAQTGRTRRSDPPPG